MFTNLDRTKFERACRGHDKAGEEELKETGGVGERRGNEVLRFKDCGDVDV